VQLPLLNGNLAEKVFVTVPRGCAYVLTLTSKFVFFYSLGMQCCSFVYDAEYIYLFLYVTRVSPSPPKNFLALILRMEEFDLLIIVMFGKIIKKI